MDSLKFRGEAWARDLSRRGHSDFFSLRRKAQATGGGREVEAFLARLRAAGGARGRLRELLGEAVGAGEDGQGPAGLDRRQALFVLLQLSNEGDLAAELKAVPDELWSKFLPVALASEIGAGLLTNLLIDDKETLAARLLDDARVPAALLARLADGRPSADALGALRLLCALAVAPGFRDHAAFQPLLPELDRLCATDNAEVAQQAVVLGSFIVSKAPNAALFQRCPRLLRRGLAFFNASSALQAQPELLVATARLLASYLFAFDGSEQLMPVFLRLVDLRELAVQLESGSATVRKNALWLASNVLTELGDSEALPAWKAVGGRVFDALARSAVEASAENRMEAVRCLYHMFAAGDPAWLRGLADSLPPLFAAVLGEKGDKMLEIALDALQEIRRRCPEISRILRASPDFSARLEALQDTPTVPVFKRVAELLKALYA